MRVILFLLISFPFIIHAQSFDIKGKIVDAKTGEPLAFVTIVYNDKNQGLTSSIDGDFFIPSFKNVAFLKFSYVGYESLTIPLSDISKKHFVVRLKSIIYDLKEVKVIAGENPAHRIIKQVTANRDLNDPEKLTSFSYKSYNKLIFTIDKKMAYIADSLKQRRRDSIHIKKIDSLNKIGKDSAFITNFDSKYHKRIDSLKKNGGTLTDFLNKQDLAIMESVSERNFMYPDKNNEKIIASRVSGLQNPSFTLMATQMQSFSFYKDLIEINGKSYLNPISKGSTSKYFFLIEDTTYSERNDTVFIISFRPKKGKTFDGLKGILRINTHKYAIESVIAEPAEIQQVMSMKIQQKYELIDNTYWFPVQLNSDIIFNTASVSDGSMKLAVIGIGKTYLTDIKLNPILNKKDFSSVQIKVLDNAHTQPQEIWNKYRNDTLSKRDLKTYSVLDSIGKKEKLDLKLQIFETIISGYIPYYFLNIDYTKLLDYNSYEGFRIGLGVVTNSKFSSWFSVGGYIGYGFDDKATKYGAKTEIVLSKDKEFVFEAKYYKDVVESGSYSFYADKQIQSSESFRNFLVNNMDITEGNELAISFRTFEYLKAKLFINQNKKNPTNGYIFQKNIGLNIPEIPEYHFTEIGLRFKYAFKERFFQTSRAKMSLGTKYPIIYGNIIRGVNLFKGEYEYTKYEIKIGKSFLLKNSGQVYFQLTGAIADGNIPICNLYNGYGSYEKFTVEASNTFATMRMNEFYSSRFINFFFSYDFGNILGRTQKIRPNLVFVTNFSVGDMQNSANHLNIKYKSPEKGYFESGILINNIYKNMGMFGYGVGVYYRYGPYQFDDVNDNFAFRMSFTFDL